MWRLWISLTNTKLWLWKTICTYKFLPSKPFVRFKFLFSLPLILNMYNTFVQYFLWDWKSTEILILQIQFFIEKCWSCKKEKKKKMYAIVSIYSEIKLRTKKIFTSTISMWTFTYRFTPLAYTAQSTKKHGKQNIIKLPSTDKIYSFICFSFFKYAYIYNFDNLQSILIHAATISESKHLCRRKRNASIAIDKDS